MDCCGWDWLDVADWRPDVGGRYSKRDSIQSCAVAAWSNGGKVGGVPLKKVV